MTTDAGRLRAWLVAGQAADAVTFALAVTAFPVLLAGETNAITLALVAAVGVLGFAGLKVLVPSLVAAALPESPGLPLRALVLAAGAAGFLGAAFNVLAVLGAA